MNLVNKTKTEQIKSVLANLKSKLESIDTKSLDETTKANLSDASAIITNLEKTKLDDKDFNNSVQKVAKLVKAYFSEGFPIDHETRKLHSDEMLAKAKPVTPRSLTEGGNAVNPFLEEPSTNPKNTASPEDPSRIAERILCALSARHYMSAQDGFDGFTESPESPYGIASPAQKVKLAKLLRAWGFSIKFDKWEKEAQKQEDEYRKIHKDYGKGKRPETDLTYRKSEASQVNNVAPSQVNAAGHDLVYCGHCSKTTKHIDGVCQSCGSKKTEQPRKSTISLYRKAQIESAAPNILQLTIQALVNKYNQFKTPLTAIDINQTMSGIIDSNFQNDSDKQEEKQYMQGNESVMNEIVNKLQENNVPFEGTTSASLREAVSKEAEEFISKKIEYLMNNESKTKEQAAGEAYGLAREKGYDVPKKSAQYGGGAPGGQGAMNGDVNNSDTSQNSVGNPNMKYSCSNCRYGSDDDQHDPNGQAMSCPHCGNKLTYKTGDDSMSPALNLNNKQQGLNQNMSGVADDTTQMKKYLPDGAQYQALKTLAWSKNQGKE